MDLRRTPAPGKRYRARRGFTLTEIVVAVAIVGILGSFTAFSFARMSAQRALFDAAREVAAEIHRLRSVVRTQGVDRSTSETYVSTGIRRTSDRVLTFFATGDGGTENVLKVLDFEDEYPNAELRVGAFAADIQFRRNATLQPGSPMAIVITNNTSGQQQTINITLTGVPRIQ